MRRKVSTLLMVAAGLALLVMGCAAPGATTKNTNQPSGSGSTSSATIFLNVTTPQDNAIVSTGTVQVNGQTLADAVVTVQGNLVSVDSQGNFTATVTLNEGPNAIEIIASDQSGNQVQENIVVNFAKGG